MGQKEREVLQKMAEITKEGFLLKQQLIQEVKKTQQEKQVNKNKQKNLNSTVASWIQLESQSDDCFLIAIS